MTIDVTFGYVINTNEQGEETSWSSSLRNIQLYLDPSNSSGLSQSSVSSILAHSMAEWNKSNDDIQLNAYLSNRSFVSRNDIYFSRDASYFAGGSIAAITQTVYREGSGEIIESDIIINGNNTYSGTPGDSNYLGDILTHELGHLIGLGHSQLLYSTMFYKLFSGQYSISPDDEGGMYSLYGRGGKSVVNGRIIGGDSIGVFGARAVFIDANDYSVLGEALSDDEGHFSFSGMAKDTDFFVYIAPSTLLSALPDTFSSVRSDFCIGRAQFKGAFAYGCGSREWGRPAIFENKNNNILNIGNLTIRCSNATPSDYLPSKGSSFDVSNHNDYFSGIGFFSKQELANGDTDSFTIDLTNNTNIEADHYLEVNVFYHDLYSIMKIGMDITSPMGTTLVEPTIDSDGNPYLNLTSKVLLDNSVMANNNFTITLTAATIDDHVSDLAGDLDAANDFSKSDHFPSYNDYGRAEAVYLFTYRILKKVGSSYEDVSEITKISSLDNSSCTEGPNTVAIRSGINKDNGRKHIEKKKAPALLACGSIGANDPPGGGGHPLISMCFGLIMVLATNFNLIKKLS